MFATTQMGGAHVAIPDVCHPGPAPSALAAPIPATNVALPAMGIGAAHDVLFMNAPAHTLATTIPSSTTTPVCGPGFASGTTMGPARSLTGSSTVLAGGVPATRLGALTMSNGTNASGATISPSQLKVVILAR